MPGLVHCTWKRNVESDFDDLVIRTQHRFRDCNDPRMRYQVHEAADLLRMDLDVVALRPASDGPTGTLRCRFERGIDVFSQLLDPFAIERGLATNDSIAVETAHDLCDIVLGLRLNDR